MVIVSKKTNDDTVVLYKNSYYVLNAIILIFPLVSDALLSIFGVNEWAVVINGRNIPLGKIILIALILIAIIAAIVYNRISYKQGQSINREKFNELIQETNRVTALNQILSKVQNSINIICLSKYETLINEIQRLEHGKSIRPKAIISNPRKQLKSIISQIVSCVASVSDLNENQFNVRVAYKFKDQEWEWIDGYSPTGFFNIENLLNTENTTFNHITRTDDHRENFIFFNRKSLAKENKKYVYEPYKDIEGDDIEAAELSTDGSILAKSIFIGNNIKDIFAEMSIFIDTTDDNLIIKSDSKEEIRNAKYILKNDIFKVYEERLKIELALLYLEHKKQNYTQPYRKNIAPPKVKQTFI